MRARGRALLPSLCLAWLAGSAPGLASAQDAEAAASAPPRIYKWVDENGIAHYTTDPERIPPSLRNRLGGEPTPVPAAGRVSGDPFDSWASRNRAEPARDVWDEALDDGSPRQLTTEELAAIAVERSEVEHRIAELETVIAEDEDALKALISDAGVTPLERGDDPNFRSIAMRLPKRLAELRSLRQRRDELAPPE